MSPSDMLYQLIDGQREEGKGKPFEVLDKFRLTPVAAGHEASPDQVTRMIDVAQAAFRKGAPGPHERGAILDRAADILATRADEVKKIIQLESGFTGSDCAGEVNRCIETLRLSANEARELRGEVIPIEGAPGQSGRIAYTMRVPLGVVLAITPFNAPLNTVAHKLAPALAAGNAVVVKPASVTPLTTLKLAEILHEAGTPPGMLNVLLGGGSVAQEAIQDPRVRFIAFTGSTDVGRKIQASAGLRRTQMELGSIAFTIFAQDGDIERAAPRMVGASFRKAGQVCTSIQIALIHRSRMEEMTERLTREVKAVKYGDPAQDGVLTGPLITESEAIRVENWVQEAINQGATALTGGPRNGAVLPPTLLTDVTPDMRVMKEEVFGPVLSLVPFDTLDEAIETVNATPYGLATGFFTNRLDDAMRAARQLEVGGVHINETSSSRVDLMPYGGSKDSGFGREGPKYAVEELTEQRIITIST